MKKAKIIGKKTLSVFLAVLMVLTAWVWVAPTEASAINAGSYYYEVSISVTNDADGWNHSRVYLHYKGNNGQDSTHSTATLSTVSDEFGENSSIKYTGTVSGFPCGYTHEYSFGGLVSWRKLEYTVTIKVGASASSTLYQIFTASYTDSSAAFSSAAGTFGSTSNITATKPKATKVVWDATPSNFTIPSSTYGRTHCIDQYGVTLGVNPTNSFTSTPTTGLSGSTSNGTSYSQYTVTASNDARMSGQGTNSRDVTMTASYTFGGATVSDSKSFTITDPSYNVTLNANGMNAGLTTTSPISRQYGDKYNVTPGATKIGFTLLGFYYDDHEDSYETVVPNSTQLTADTIVTENHTWYAAWQANQYTMKFTYRNKNGEWVTSDEITEYFGRNIPFPTVSSPVNSGMDYTYTFTGWSPAHTTVQAVEGVTEYVAQYDEEVHYADKTALSEAIAKAEEKMNEQKYIDGGYTAETVAAFQSVLQQADDATDMIYLLSQQSAVDAIIKNLLNSINNLKSKSFIVMFVDEDGTILKDGYHFVEYGDKVEIPANPTQEPDADYHYEFLQWDSTLSDGLDACNYVTDDLRYIANFNAFPHEFTETVTPSTCTADGIITKECSCGYSYTVAGETANHKWSTDYKEIIPATCATKGAEAKYCTACGAIDESTKRDIAKLGHNWGAYTEYTPATCFGKGAEIAECSRCGGKDVKEIAKKTHAYGKAETIEKTCTTDGYTKEVCTLCGFTNIRDIDKATGHSISETTVHSTCVSSGYTKEECANCDYEKTTILPATGVHTFIDNWTTVSEASCVGHGVEKRVCTVCKAATETRLTDLAAHTEPADWTTEKEAWCGLEGKKVKDCTVCGKELATEVIPALSHNYKEYADGSYAETCTSAGAKAEKCSRCGDINIDVIDPLGHDWDEGKTTAATCTSGGYITYTCQRDKCGETRVEIINGSTALTHDFDETIEANVTEKTPATCESDGHKTVKCTRCDVTNEVIIPKLGHNYGEWDKTTNPATNDKDGTWTRECANCHNIETITIPKGGHNFVEDITKYVAPKCNAKGQRVYKCGAHENCIATVTVELDYAQHTIVKENKEATCTEKGYSKTYCSVCKEVFNSVDIPVKAHEYKAGDEVAPTCTTSGYTPYKCENCTSIYNMYDENQPATGHVKWTEISRENATCTADGSVEYKCEKCDATKTEVLPKTGHNYTEETTAATNATCTALATKTYKCSCGASYMKHEGTLAAHKFDTLVKTVPATNESLGYEERKCVCGLTEITILEATGTHVFEEKIESECVAPTCTENGTDVYKCKAHTDCGVKSSVLVPRLGHSVTAVYNAPTCTAEGSSEAYCVTCTKTVATTKIPAIGHAYNSVEVTKEAGCENEGVRTYSCSCGATRTEEISEKGHSFKTTVTDATCTSKGLVVTECTACKKESAKTTIELAAKNHNWNDGEIKDGDAATCTESGTKTYTCTICSATKTEDVDALGHNWDEWVKVDATNDKDGSWTRTCKNDANHTETVIIPKGNHQWDDGTVTKEASCTGTGTKVYKCKTHTGEAACGVTITITLDKLQHELETTKTDAKCEDNGEVVTKCEHCDTTTITTIIPAKGHSYTGKVTKDPTCTEEGEMTYTCAHDSKHTYTEAIAKLQHSFELKETVQATCTTKAYEKYACSCGESYVKFIEGQVAGHNYKTVEGSTTATCTNGGKLTLKCENCGDEIIADVPALGHDYVEDISAATTATCKAPATKTYKCNNAGCGNTYVEYVSGTVAHTWGNWTTIQEVTTTSHGIEKRECSVCNVVEHKTTPPTGAHEFENKGEKPATCTEEGYINWVCKTHTDCEANYIETLDKLPHTEKIAYTDPTCTALGSTKIICDICKVTIGEEKTIPALGHTWNNGEVTTQPTCQTEGVMTFKCTVNGCNGTKTTAIAKNSNAHVYSVTTTEATCTTPATTVYKCACGDEKTVVTNFTLGHKWETEKTVEIPATCTSTGIKSTHCANCSETKDEETIPALNHTEKTEKIEATCTTAGYSAEVCDVCKTLLGSVVITEAKGHSWTTKTKAATCTDCATETKTCTVEGCDATETIITANPNGHTWGDWTIDSDKGKKVRACIIDGCDATEECPAPTSGHNWNEGEEALAATCYSEGEMTYTCEGCEICTAAGTIATVTLPTPKLAHTYETVTSPATCTDDGSVVVKCKIEKCGNVAGEATLPKSGHTLVRNTAGDKAATCNDIGWYAYKCNNLNCTYTETIEIAKLGHSYSATATETQQPTCTENGSKKYKCSRCDEAIVTEIPALGHSFTETTVVAQTCTEKGYTIKFCSNDECGAKYVVADSFTKALGHNWSEWETVTPATNDAEGLKKHICKVENCGVVEYAPIPMLGHQWNDGEVTTAATCETVGEKKYTCIKENCPACDGTPTTYTETIPATGHKMKEEKVKGNCLVPSYSEWTCENNCDHAYIIVTGEADGHDYKITAEEKATCEADGSISYECNDCHDKYVEIIPKLGHTYTTHEVKATCTTSGYIEYTCINDSKHTYKEFNAEPKGHSLGNWTVTLAPTDAVDGTKERSCSKCNYKETQTVPALIHNMVETENLAATCKNTGHITYKCNLTHEGYDKACEYSYTVTLPVVAHSLTTEKSAPSCDKEGYIRTICNNTGCDYKEEIKTAALGHNWNDGETTPSTCQKQGNILYTCLRCGGTKNVKLELAQHTMIIDKEASKEATCTSRGYETYKCSVAGCSYGYSILGAEPTGHQNKKVETTPSTCKMSGLKKTICKDCNTILSVEVLPLAEHSYTKEVTAPTCTTAGYTTYTCDCGLTFTSDFIEAKGHTYIGVVTGPTCTEAGYTTYTCDCGESYVGNPVAADGHDWNSWTESKPSTNDEEGEMTRTCKNDKNHVERVVIPKGGHRFDGNNPASTVHGTCQNEGHKEFDCLAHMGTCGVSITVNTGYGAHNWSDWTKVDATNDKDGSWKRECAVCHETETHVIPKGNHTFGDKPSSTVPATCKKAGTATYNCTTHTNCGVTITVVLDMIQHTPKVDKKDASCTEIGYVKTYCEKCNDVISYVELPATGHINTSVVREESTCIKKGTEKVICACGHIVSVKELPLAEHDYEMTYENGVYTYTCKVEGCKHSYTETVETTFTVKFFAADKKTVLKTEAVKSGEAATAPAAPSKGADDNYHYTFSEWDRDFTEITSDLDVYPTYEKEAHYGGAATCTEKAVCDECGTGYGETDASKHVIDTKVTPATCEKDGVLEYYCTENGCTYSKTEVIKKTGHSLGAWETYQNGNCATPTIKIRKCRNNGCKYYEQKESYGSHTWYIQPEVAPTCTTVGYSEYKYCTTCGMEIDSVVIPKLNHRDNDGDGNCDYCTYTEPVLKCSCMCHSSGFMKFIYSIVRFFWIITKSQPTCNCGANHY